MNKIFSIIAIFLMGSSLSAQQNKQVTKEQLELFKNSTTYVVMDDDPLLGYNITAKAAVEKYWRVTPYKFITNAEFESLRKEKTNSFLLLTRTSLTKDKQNAQYLYINLLMGDNVEKIDDMPEIVTLPLQYTGVDENSYVYKMGVMIRFIQEHAKALLAIDNPRKIRDLKSYNTNIKKIKNKTIYIEETDLAEEVNSLEKIKAIYPYEVKIVSSDEMEKAVNEQTPGVLIAHQISPGADDKIGRSYKMLFGADDAQLYYYYFVKISDKRPAGFLAFDFKRFKTGL